MITYYVGNFVLSTFGPLLLVVPVAALAVVALLRLRKRFSRAVRGAMGIGVAVILLVAALYIVPTMERTSPNVYIDIGEGYVAFLSGPTGEVNVSSQQILNASVVHMDTGILVMHKQHGESMGVSSTSNHENLGVFSLANGHTAYVASNNLTNLVVERTDGTYLVLGPEHTTKGFLENFSRLVYPISGYQASVSGKSILN